MAKTKEYKPKYTIQQLTFDSLYKKVCKPKIQRGAVWTQKKQNELIETIKKGFPIGTLLLLRTNGKYEYEVLDGQQRYTTLCNYKDNISSFMKKDDLDIEALIKCLKSETSDKKIKKSLANNTDYYRKKRNEIFNVFKKNKGNVELTTKEVVDYICAKEDIDKKDIKNNFRHITLGWVEQCLDKYEIDRLQLPCIVLNEKLSDNEKADAFIIMNTPGAKLTKYDYYAAKWTNEKELVCGDVDIIQKINERYSDKYNTQVKYVDAKEYSLYKENKVKIFEYVYALSKIIDDRINNLLGEDIAKDNKVATLGFILISETLGIESTKMGDLPEKLLKIKNLVDYKNKLIGSVEKVFDKLKSSFTAPDGNIYLDHTENQIASFIISYFKLNYEIRGDGKITKYKAASRDTNIFFSYILEHYIYDNLRDFWSGTGDKKMHDIAKDAINSRYMSPVPKEVMLNQLNDWFKDKNIADDVNPTDDTKMFITFLLNQTTQKKYPKGLQWEHICIKDKLLNSDCKNGMSSPACITLIPQFDNGSKGKLTYYEYAKTKESLLKLDNKELAALLYPKEKEIAFVQGASGKRLNKANFEKFKENRTKILIDMSINALYK